MNRIKPTPPFPSPTASFRRRPESRIKSARFALLCDAEVARVRGIPAFAGMTEKKAGMTKREAGMADIGHASEKFFRATVAHSSAIPAKAGIQCMKRALRAPFNGGAARQVLQCARTALDLCWIPAFAGMAKKRCGPGAAAPNPAIPAQQSAQKPCGHPANKSASAIPAKQAVQKLRAHPANKPHPAIPAKAGIQCMKRALRAPFEECAAADCCTRQGRVQGGAE